MIGEILGMIRSCISLTEGLLRVTVVPAAKVERRLLLLSLTSVVLHKKRLMEWRPELIKLRGLALCKRIRAELISELFTLRAPLKKVKMGMRIWFLKEEVKVVPTADVCFPPIFIVFYYEFYHLEL